MLYGCSRERELCVWWWNGSIFPRLQHGWSRGTAGEKMKCEFQGLELDHLLCPFQSQDSIYSIYYFFNKIKSHQHKQKKYFSFIYINNYMKHITYNNIVFIWVYIYRFLFSDFLLETSFVKIIQWTMLNLCLNKYRTFLDFVLYTDSRKN